MTTQLLAMMPAMVSAFSIAELPSAYGSLLQSSPVLTKALTSATLFGVSDMIAQTSDTEPFSQGRQMRFMATGFGSGVFWHHWFVVNAYLTAGIADQPALSTAAGVALEQFVACPLYFSLYLIPILSALRLGL